MTYAENITGEIDGAEDAGLRVQLIADEARYDLNPRDNVFNACLVLAGGRQYANYDERGDKDKPGSFLDLSKKVRDQQYGWIEDDFDWSDDWAETVARLVARGCEAAMVARHGYDGGASLTTDARFADGVIFATPEMMRKWHMKKRLTKEIRALVRDGLATEMDEYSKWAMGDVWGVVIEDARTGDELDSCWGFIGDEYARESAKEMAAPVIDERRKARELVPHPWAAFDVPALIA